jgi:hypothetical protein
VPAKLGLEFKSCSGKKTAPTGGARLTVSEKKGKVRVGAGLAREGGKQAGPRGGRKRKEKKKARPDGPRGKGKKERKKKRDGGPAQERERGRKRIAFKCI